MRAVELQESHASGLVAEDHEVLAHDPDPQRHVEEVAGEGHGLPEAPEVFAAGVPGPTRVSSGSGGGTSRAR